MLPDLVLGFRGSNSVCGRFIQKDKLPCYHSTDPFDDHSPVKTDSSTQHKYNDHILARRTVKVLDLNETSKTNKDVFILFKKRLHSWTTIKVSNRILVSLWALDLLNLSYSSGMSRKSLAPIKSYVEL